MEYYKKEIENLKDAVADCRQDVPKKIHYFLKEANAHSSGIPKEVEEEVERLAHLFNVHCRCYTEDPLDLRHSTYEESPHFSGTKTARGHKREKRIQEVREIPDKK